LRVDWIVFVEDLLLAVQCVHDRKVGEIADLRPSDGRVVIRIASSTSNSLRCDDGGQLGRLIELTMKCRKFAGFRVLGRR